MSATTPHEWTPLRVVRFIEQYGTSTRPMLVETDAGQAYIKTIDNPLGPPILVAEWVCHALSPLLDVPVPDAAIIEIGPDSPLPHSSGPGSVSKAFASRKIVGATFHSADLLKDVLNRADIPGIVLFDTWVRNPDRYAPPSWSRGPNRDNLFLEQVGNDGYRMVAIDHGHCLTNGRPISRHVAHIDAVKDASIYGLFPEFEDHWRSAKGRILELCRRLEHVDRRWVESVLDSVPLSWGFTADQRAWLLDFLCSRAGFLGEGVPLWLFPEQDPLFPRRNFEEEGHEQG